MKAKKYNYKGKTYNINELLQFSNVTINTLRQRLYKGQWTVEECVEIPPGKLPVRHKKKTKYMYNGKLYSIYQLADIAKISVSCIYKRINILNLSVKEAVERPMHYREDTDPRFKDTLNLDEMIKNGLNRPSKYDFDNTKWIKEIMR